MKNEKIYVIEIERIEKNDEINYKDLKVFHRDCLGGEIVFGLDEDGHMKFACKRCKARRIVLSDDVIAAFFRAAFSGGETKFKTPGYESYVVVAPKA